MRTNVGYRRRSTRSYKPRSYKRTTYRRYGTGTTKRTYRRYARRPVRYLRRPRRSNDNTQLINVKNELVGVESNLGTTTRYTYGNIYVSAATMNANSAYGARFAMFHHYRINRVYVKFDFPAGTDTEYLGTNGIVPDLYTCVMKDDDTTTVASTPVMIQTGAHYRKARARGTITRTFKPHCDASLYQSVSTTGYTPSYSPWINTRDSSVPHWGLRWLIENPLNANAGINVSYRVRVVVYLQFKDLKTTGGLSDTIPTVNAGDEKHVEPDADEKEEDDTFAMEEVKSANNELRRTYANVFPNYLASPSRASTLPPPFKVSLGEATAEPTGPARPRNDELGQTPHSNIKSKK